MAYKKVSNNLLRGSVLSLMVCTLVACNNNVVEPQIASVRLNTEPSCFIALTAHQGTSQLDKVIQNYQVHLKQNQDDFDQWEKLSWAYVDKARADFDPGFYKLAEQVVVCMNKQQPETLATMLVHGHILHNLHQFKEAEVYARQLVKRRGYWYDYGLLGDVLMEQGELESAILAYQQMMDQNPGSQAYNRAAYVRWLKGDVDGAIELLQLSAKSPVGRNNINGLWAMTRLAEYEFQSGNIGISLRHLSAVLKRQPKHAPALLLQGRINMAQGNINSAIGLLTQALQLNPLPEYRWALIEALSEQDDIDKQKQRDELQQQLMQAGATEDRRTYALYLASTGIDDVLAVSLAEQELQIRHDVITLDTYAWALRSNHQLKEAKKYSNKALNEGTQSARLFYHAGVIAKENGLLEEALPLLKQAKALEHNLWPSERKHLNQTL